MFKKIRKPAIVLALFVALTTFLVAPSAYANSCGGAKTSIIECEEYDSGIWPLLRQAVEIITCGITVLATIGIIVAGASYMTARDNEEQTKKAKKRIVEVIIGLVIYFTFFGSFELLVPGGTDVTKVEIANISSDVSSLTLEVGEEKKIPVNIEPAEAAMYQRLAWSSSDDTIATVTKVGSVRAQKAGNATITISSGNGKKITVSVTVKEPEKSTDDNKKEKNKNR